MNLPEVNVDKFWKDGYLLIKNVFSAEEIATIRQSAETFHQQRDKTRSGGDILSNKDPVIYRLIFDDRILHAARAILGGELVYFGDSTISYGSHHRGWHKDNRIPDRFKHTLADWNGKYTLIRFGIYLQDHISHSGGLGIRVGSHEPSGMVKRLDKLKVKGLSDIKNQRLRTRLSIKASNAYGKAIIVDSEPGDLLVWNQRTTHSGNAVRFKGVSKVKFPAWVENKAPQNVQLPYESNRIALFMTYGLDDAHLRNAIEFLKKRKYMVDSWKVSNVSEDTLNEIDAEKLKVMPPPQLPADWKTTMA